MLYQRVLTALVALPVTIAAILWLPVWGLAAVVGALMLVGAWEWGGLMRLAAPARTVFLLTVAVCLVALGLDGPAASVVDWRLIWLFVAGLFWLLVVAQLARFPNGWDAALGRTPVAFVVGCIALAAPMVAVVVIDRSHDGPWLVLLLCVMIWGADTGAYFAGRTLGRHKLIVNVSPGKTIEGAVGGLLVSMIAGALGAFLLGYSGMRILSFTILGGWIALVSIVGDLTISMFKRSAGQKDSGFLFPGHGGVLDRLDSLIAAAPWFVIGLMFVR